MLTPRENTKASRSISYLTAMLQPRLAPGMFVRTRFVSLWRCWICSEVSGTRVPTMAWFKLCERCLAMKSQAATYEDILRAIGQELENLCVTAFELEYLDGEFVVSGEAQKTVTPQPIHKKSIISMILKLGEKNSAPKRETLTVNLSDIRFTSNDIILFSRKGRALRFSSGSGAPDPHSLSHILRMVGAYLDSRTTGLSKLSWRSSTLTLWATNRAGTKTKKDFAPSEMYNFWVHQFKKRTPGAA